MGVRHWLPTLDLCRQALKQLKRWEGPSKEELVAEAGGGISGSRRMLPLEERKRALRQEAEWMLALSLYSVNDLNGACEHGSNV